MPKILFCSDYDGTLCPGERVTEDTVDAIRAFTEKGGLFTLCTGRRAVSFLTPECPFSVYINAPIVGISGAELYDPAEDRYGWRVPLRGGWKKVVRRMADEVPYRQTFELVGNTSLFSDPEDPDSVERILEEIGDGPVYKVVSYSDYRGAALYPAEADNVCGGEWNLLSNGCHSFEFTDLSVNKGKAVTELKRMVGADMLICVGDFGGDIPMLRAADVGCAMGDGHPDAIAAADRVTGPAGDGAVAALLREFTQML